MQFFLFSLPRYPLPHFLHHFYHHFALTGNDLLDAVIELEEGILAVDDETERTGLAHQDAALTKREGTIARISSTSCARSTLLSESRHRLAIICYKSIKNPRDGKVANPQKMMGKSNNIHENPCNILRISAKVVSLHA